MLSYITVIKNPPNETLNCSCDPRIITKENLNLFTADLGDLAVKRDQSLTLSHSKMLKIRNIYWNWQSTAQCRSTNCEILLGAQSLFWTDYTKTRKEEKRKEWAVRTDTFSACGWWRSVLINCCIQAQQAKDITYSKMSIFFFFSIMTINYS